VSGALLAPSAPASADVRSDLITSTVVSLPVSSLSHGLAVRLNGICDDHVRALAEASGPLPPIIVHKDDMTVVDGMHRLCAARLSGRSQIDAVYFLGDEAEAFVLAVRLNSQHGLPLSCKERRMAVEHVVAAFPSWSDRRIAVAVGVSHRTVAAVRRSTGESVHPNVRVGLDGRRHPVDTSPGRVRVAELLATSPDAALRKVASAAGVSVSTVHHIRGRGRLTPAPGNTGTGSGHPTPAGGEPTLAKSTGGSVRSIGNGSREAAGPARMRRGTPDVSSVLRSLLADPSMKATADRRNLLRLLTPVLAASHLDHLASAVPPHRREAVGSLARECADMWVRFAATVEGVDSSPPASRQDNALADSCPRPKA
jgi:hypothetical protein